MSEPLHIAHVVFGLGMGGLETGMVNLVKTLPPGSFRHTVLCLKELGPNAERMEAMGVEVRLLGRHESSTKDLFPALRRHLKELRPDVLHARNFGTIDAVVAAKLAGVPKIIFGEHGFDVFDPDGRSKKRRFLRGMLSPLVHRYICVSQDLADWLKGHRGFFGEKVHVIRNGVDPKRFRPAHADAPPREGALVIGTLARLAAIKDQASLISAFAQLAPHYPQARLRIVGEGPERDRLEALAAESGHAERIELPGATDDAPEALAGFDLFVLPSINEGISNTILEAMASGLPVVASAVGGNPELVVEGETGRLVPAQDPVALAAALRSYLDDAALRHAHGQAGRERMLAEFSLEAMAAAYARVWRGEDHQQREGGA